MCAFELCHTQCQETRDCPSGQRCVHTDDAFVNVCQLPEEATCDKTSQCKGKQVCTPDGECRDVCQDDRDCVVGQKCSAERGCAEPEELGPDGHLGAPDGGIGGSGGTGGCCFPRCPTA